MVSRVVPASPDLGAVTISRISRRILPWVTLLFLIAYLDRSNISYASLLMTRELNFSSEVFGFGAGVFFLGYFLLDVPGSILVENWSARKWITAILITWGFIASATAFISSPIQFYGMRFFLGLAEGGFFPGVIVYLSHWFRQAERGKAAALFLTAIPVSQIVCGPISAALLKVHWMGYSGWRWMLFLEGIPAVICGIITFFWFNDKPSGAAWLKPAERDWICGELERERKRKAPGGHSLQITELFRNRDILLLTGTMFCFQCANYGLLLWLPKMIQAASGKDASTVSLLTTIPFLFGLPAAYFSGWYSDRRKERRKHASAYCGLLGAALLLSQIPGEPWGVTLVFLALAMCGVYAFNPVFYLLPSTFLAGTSAAASLGFITGVGHLGGFLGPYAIGYLITSTGTHRAGILFLSASAFVGSLLLLSIRRSDKEAFL
jgi:MFS transporter, ACS family, tartrate transporter